MDLRHVSGSPDSLRKDRHHRCALQDRQDQDRADSEYHSPHLAKQRHPPLLANLKNNVTNMQQANIQNSHIDIVHRIKHVNER